MERIDEDPTYVLPNDPVAQAELDSLLLDGGGLVRPHPAAVLRALDLAHFRAWMHLNAVYCYPTIELIEWLRETIGGLPALEIAAGNGSIGRALGLRRTDSGDQDSERGQLAYALGCQIPTKPPADVERLEALAAVRRYRPHTVFATWATHLRRVGDPANRGGVAWGVDEAALLRRVRRYVLVGNLRTHRHKPILARRHDEVVLPGIVSRGRPEWDRIWVWRGLGMR